MKLSAMLRRVIIEAKRPYGRWFSPELRALYTKQVRVNKGPVEQEHIQVAGDIVKQTSKPSSVTVYNYKMGNRRSTFLSSASGEGFDLDLEHEKKYSASGEKMVFE